MKLMLVASVAAGVVGVAGVAHAQRKFEYGKADEVKDVKATEWSATVESGLVFTTGNSRTTTLSGTAKATRKQKKNKLAIEASGTFARASTVAAKVAPGVPLTAGDVTRSSKVSAQAYSAKLRYDRFLSEFDSLFIAALGGGDVVAGKDFVGGGQVGYARVIYKTEKHELSGELGYDFSFEDFVDETASSISIHSARGFLGYKGTLTEATGLEGTLEVLGNLNGQGDDVSAMEDLRATGVVSLSTKLSKSISFAFSVTGKFDNVPAPFSLAGYTIDPTDPPEALKLDTTTKATLIVTLL